MIETIAAYLGIIDIAVRLARYSDRKVRKGLNAAARAIHEQDDGSVDDARETLRTVLTRQLGSERSAEVTHAIAVIEELASGLDPAFYADTAQSLMPYGRAFNKISRSAGELLARRRAFEAWSMHRGSQTVKHTSDGISEQTIEKHYLPMPYTGTALARSSGLPHSYWRDLHLCLCRRAELFDKDPSHELHLCYFRRNDGNPKFHSVRLLFFRDFELRWGRVFGTMDPDPPQGTIPVNFDVFESLFLGMLMDTIAYDQKARSEIRRSSTLIRALLRLGRGEPHPF